MACEEARRELEAATIRLEGRLLVVQVGRASGALPLPPVEPAASYPGSPWESGVSTWTDAALYLAPDGRLWVERVDWEDVHLAGRWPKATWWLVSADGATWTAGDPPADRGRPLGQASS